MQIFEFLFNPLPAKRNERGKKFKTKQSAVFDSFIFEPENIDEKKLGYLCMIGELSNPLPQQSNFLDSLAQVIKSSYYSFPIKPSAERALKESLKKANEFLSETAHKGDVSWLGNLNLTILTLGLNSPNNSIELNFTKAGNHKLFLLREGQTMDISHDLELQNIEPYPPKAFGNIISGQLNRGDRLLVLSKDIFSVFNQLFKKTNKTPHRFSAESGGGQNLLSHLAKVSDFSEKSIKKILKAREKELNDISGICLAIDLSEKSLADKLKLPFIVKKQKTSGQAISIGHRLSNKLNNFKKAVLTRLSSIHIFSKISLLLWRREYPAASGGDENRHKNLPLPAGRQTKGIPRPCVQGRGSSFNRLFSKLSTKLSKLSLVQAIAWTRDKKKNLILICGFILILVLGFLLIGKQTQKENQEVQQVMTEAQLKIDQAQNALIIKDEKLANKFLLEAWKIVSPLMEEKRKNKELVDIKEKIESELKKLNKLEEIKEPKLLAELDMGFNPQKIIILNNNLYFYAPALKKIYSFPASGDGLKQNLEAPKNIKFAALLEFSLVLFLENNNLVSLLGNQWSSEFNLDKPFVDFTCDYFSSYQSNLYCLNKGKGQILKYNYFTNLFWGSAQNWLKNNQEKLNQAKSMAIDGSVWVLNQNNSIDRYRLREYQETIDINIFPLTENITAIKTTPTLPYLYLLEASQKRIIILTKEGKIHKQIFSEKFNNLKDFEISTDGKIIWLLNGLRLYQIEL